MTFFPKSFSLSGRAADLPVESDGHTLTEALIERCLRGDKGAHAALYNHHAAYAYRLAYGLLQNKEDAEEVLQDSFTYAFRRLDRYDAERAAFRTWLYQIVVSRCRNKRRRKWLPTFSLSVFTARDEAAEDIRLADEDAPAPEEEVALAGRRRVVWYALGQLSPKLRETAVLRYYEGLTYREIGRVLDIPAKTAESRMRLAHKALHDLLHEYVRDEGVGGMNIDQQEDEQ